MPKRVKIKGMISHLYPHKGYVYINFMRGSTQVRKSLKIRLENGHIPNAARIIQKKIEADIVNGRYGVQTETKKITLKDFLEEYKEHRAGRVSGRSSDLEPSRIQKLVDFFPGRTLDSISTKDADMFIGSIIPGRKGITVNGYIKACRAFYNLAVRWEYVAKNPFKDVKKLPVDDHEPRVLSSDELASLNKSIILFPKIKDYYYIYLLTGMRMTEPLSLTWDDVDFEQCQIKLRKTKTHRGRTVFFGQRVKEILLSRRSLPVPFGEWTGNEDELSKAFTQLFRAAGISNASLKTLRSNYASYLTFAGVPESFNNNMLGHTKEVSRKHYVNIVSKMIQDNLKTVEDMLVDKRSEQALAIK